jgi:iron complex outermembrane receptor protein
MTLSTMGARRAALIAATMLSAATPWAAHAAEVIATANDASSVSEVTVTAEPVRQSVGLKTEASVAETPQSVSIITAEQITLRGAQSIQDTLNYTAGVRSDAYGNDGRVDSFNVRTATPAQFLDGLRLTYGFYNTGKVDPYALERVEVLRGPSSVLYGQSSIGGVVNMVTKRPGFSRQGEVVASYGTFNRAQVQADFTGPLTSDESLAVRITGLLRKADSQVDFIEDDRFFIAPSVTWRPTDWAELTLLLHHQEDKTGSTTQFFPWEGRIFANPNGHIPTSRFAGDPSWEKYDTTQTNVTLASIFDLNAAWQVRQNFRYTWSEVDYQSSYPNSYTNPLNPWLTPAKDVIGRTMSASYPRVATWAVDTQAQGKFATGALDHVLLLGVDYQNYKEKRTQVTAGPTTAVDLFNPSYAPLPRRAVVNGTTSTQSQLGFYLQDQIKLDALTVVLGLRRDEAESETITAAGLRTKQKDEATTYRVGVLYTFANGLAPYISYSEAFTPVAGTNLAGEGFDPQLGKQWEAGVKWQLGPDALLSAAVYDIKDTNRLTTSPTNPLDRVQTGEVSAKGVELEATANIGKAWMVSAAYTYTDAEISKSNTPGEVGKPFGSVPEHAASAWAMRTFAVGDDAFVRLGGGVRYIGESVDRNTSGSIVITTPSYTLADLMMSYDRADWRFALNVNNLFDKDYDATCLSRGDCFIGQRRTIVGSLTRRF